MAIHPSTNGGQTYPCTRPGCTRVFKVAAKLRMHDDVVHKNLEGKYKCQFCPKKFWGKSSLREHTNGVHLNTKPHKCELCDFSSAYRSKYIVLWNFFRKIVKYLFFLYVVFIFQIFYVNIFVPLMNNENFLVLCAIIDRLIKTVSTQ